MEVYAWGSGNYGRLGQGHGGDAERPLLVSGVLNGCDITHAACSWYHSAVVTSAGDVATFGTKVTKCLGADANDSEGSGGGDSWDASDASSGSAGEDDVRDHEDEQRRRRGPGLHGGEPGWQPAAKKSRKRPQRHCTADFVPHVLRSFPSKVTVTQVAVGSDMLGAHTLAVTNTGRLYSWGYGPACGLGGTANVSTPTLVSKFLGTGAGERGSGRKNADLEPPGWGRHSRHRQRASNRHLGLQVLRPRVVKAVCGGCFSAVLSHEGEVFTFGLSASGRLGFRTKFRAQLRPRRIETLTEGTIDLAAGASFVLLCSAAGRLLAWGDNCKGQLGIGHLQESHEPVVLGRACPNAFVMQAVAAGDSHSLALDSAGRTYSWGGEGGPMTGQGQPLADSLQVDAAFQFRLRQLSHWWVRPSPVRALQSTRIVHIDAGCLHSVALSQDGSLFAWGATLQAGTSTSNRALGAERREVSWVPRLLAPSPKLPLVCVATAAAGGWHSMLTATTSCPIAGVLDLGGEYGQDSAGFCDGFLVSSVDSSPGEESRVWLCCAAMRARLALPDGTNSPTWRAVSAQIVRTRTEQPGCAEPEQDRPGEDDDRSDDEEEEEGCLMDIVEMHRKRPRPPSKGKLGLGAQSQGFKPCAGHTSDADEAAGKPLSNPGGKKAREGPDVSSVSEPRRPPVPIFSSDSDSSDAEARVRPARGGVQQHGRPPSAPGPSSWPSRPPRAAVAVARPDPRREVPDLGLAKFSEAVLAALVRFLHTDSLGRLEVIDELHPAWLREQQLKLRPLGPTPGEEAAADGAAAERPTLHRAAKGLLLRSEVTELRGIAKVLSLERLACLCDQALLRADAPGVPALFVPASTMVSAMWTLLQQTRSAPSRDGPDTRVLCGPPLKRRPGWGPRAVPLDGEHLAHAFVLCVGCSNLRVEDSSDEGDAGGHKPSVGRQGSCFVKLRRAAAPGSPLRFELDLRDVAADTVLAWLRYLYTQDDLLLVWPCEGRSKGSTIAAEGFWIDLLRLAQRLGDKKLQLYAQDTLVGALSAENWPHMAILAEQTQCHMLFEAALMMGLRLLLPATLASFRVATGLEEGGDAAQPAGSDGAGGGVAGQAATVNKNTPGHPCAFHNTVELELESHLLQLDVARGTVLTLKQGSPTLLAELKQRLADAVTNAQKTGAQLQHCAQYFQSHERDGGRDDGGGHPPWMELASLAVLLLVFVILGVYRRTVLSSAAVVLEPLRALVSYLDLGGLPYLGSSKLWVGAINVVMFVILGVVMWTSLAKG